MMLYLWLLFCLIIAYLIGSIPTSIWVGQYFYQKDVRQFGSGNPGASNTFRVLGRKPGTFVLLIDILKGALATSLIYFTAFNFDGNIIPWMLLAGFMAVLGHLYPIFAKFHGGKGVATLLGVILALHPYSALSALAVFIILLLTTRHVSVGSIGAALSYPAILFWVFKWDEPFLLNFALAMTLLVILTHRSNIKRLIKGQESKVNLFG